MSVDLFLTVARLYRLTMDSIKDGYLKHGRAFDVTSVQAMILLAIPPEGITSTELKRNGFYTGTNATYNLKALTQMGYIRNEECMSDKRKCMLYLTESGLEVATFVRKCMDETFNSIGEGSNLMLTNCKLLEAKLKSNIRHIY